jgi:pectate lyase
MKLTLALAALLLTPGLMVATPAYASTAPEVSAAHAPTPAAPVWADEPNGFASVPGPDGVVTTGGAGGAVVQATTLDELRTYALATEPLTVQVVGMIKVTPYGNMVRVASDKTIIGVGAGAGLDGGGLFVPGNHNVIIRNLTIGDSYVPGDWDGKTADNDGIRLDTANHIWIDHVKIQRVDDGGIDIRKDSDYITLSWNIFSDINKALGVGWTTNQITKLTAHHNWIRNTVQRNWSIDNTAAAHLYDNYLSDIQLYGTMVRNLGKVVVEDTTFERVNDPLVIYGTTGQLMQRGNVFLDTTGRIDSTPESFDPASFYPYTPEPAAQATALVKKFAGPQPLAKPARTPRTVTVALDGTGDFGDLQAALGSTRDADGPVTIVVKPGIYHEQVRIFADQHVSIVGSTDNPADVVISYNLGSAVEKFYGGPWGNSAPTLTVLADGTKIKNVTIENAYDETAQASPAPAVRTAADRVLFENTRFLGDQGTFIADTAPKGLSRTLLRGCDVEGNLDFIAGPGTAVFDKCTIAARGGPITAASTSADQPYGFLFNQSVFTGDAAAGTVTLGRPGSASAQVVVRNSVLGEQIATAPWIDSDGLSWRDARFAEYANTGPGAAVNADRPQLSRWEAPRFTVDAYLHSWS